MTFPLAERPDAIFCVEASRYIRMQRAGATVKTSLYPKLSSGLILPTRTTFYRVKMVPSSICTELG